MTCDKRAWGSIIRDICATLNTKGKTMLCCLHLLQVGSLVMASEFNKHFEDFYKFFMQGLEVIVPSTVNIPDA